VNKWEVVRGNWNVKEDVLFQSQKGIDAFAVLKNCEFEDCTIELKAKKISGTEGFRIIFGGADLNNYFMADMGSHTNESVIFREINNEGSISLFDYRNNTSIKYGLRSKVPIGNVFWMTNCNMNIRMLLRRSNMLYRVMTGNARRSLLNW